MAPQKGKQGTKGQKQILEENKDTVRFYSYLAAGATVINLLLQYLFFWESTTLVHWVMLVIAVIVYVASIQFMSYMARPSYTDSGQLMDGGTDLNMESGIAEHVKDLVILTAACQILALLSNYFWLLWLAAPGRAGYLLWKNILGPWFFQPAPEADEKKQKKIERKMVRRR